ncbi:MAG: glycosyltransferase family 2 protein [Bacteroidia bacterium]
MAGYKALELPIPIKDQVWPLDVVPVVSVRVMVYNHIAYLADCINGILQQKTNFPVQVLIHDDCSTDGCSEILREYQKKYKERIKVYFQEQNTFRSALKHELRKPFFDLIKGEYIALCEGDDFWIDTNKLQAQYEFALKNPDLSMVFTGTVFRYVALKKDVVINPYENQKVFDACDYLSQEPFISSPTMFYKKAILLNKENWMSKSFAGDFVLKYQALVHGKIGYLNAITAVYNRGVPNSWSNRKLTKQVIRKEYKDNIRGLNFLRTNIDIPDTCYEFKKRRLRKAYYHKYALLENGSKRVLRAVFLLPKMGIRYFLSILKWTLIDVLKGTLRKR